MCAPKCAIGIDVCPQDRPASVPSNLEALCDIYYNGENLCGFYCDLTIIGSCGTDMTCNKVGTSTQNGLCGY